MAWCRGVVKEKAIIWTMVHEHPCHLMASIGHNEIYKLRYVKNTSVCYIGQGGSVDIGSGEGISLNWWQAITWTSDQLALQFHTVSLGYKGLK